MKTAVVIPGFRHQVESGPHKATYEPLLRDLKAAGYRTVPIKITWERSTMNDWVPEAEAQIKGADASQTLLIGFSYGAMISSVLATRHPFGRVFLCSLSPYFAEDIPRAKKSWLTMVGHRRVSVFERLPFASIVKDYKAKQTTVFAGEVEMAKRKFPMLGERGRAAGAQLPHTHFVAVPGAGHDISHANYRAAIKSYL